MSQIYTRPRLTKPRHPIRPRPVASRMDERGPQRRPDSYFGLSRPSRPCASPLGPDVKKSVVESAPGPNVRPQSPTTSDVSSCLRLVALAVDNDCKDAIRSAF